ncbi:MlaD family protein [Helicobacter cinaedi]|uniref:MlaD family protein n=1 Tax=Helicobacter cinaedi TaxID=213 RepID=UPI000CF19F60|nr:MlaD family protein [Helicobacter cinaedi]
MERNVRYVWIGAVFFIILILMVLFVLWLNRFELDSAKYTRYYAYSADEVSGVGANTPIRYKGISVGRVQSVGFKDIKSGVIAITMLIDSKLEIKQNAKVIVASQGLAGANYLSLIQGEGEILQANEDGNKVIMLDKGGLDKILGKAGELSEDITILLTNLNSTFSKENLANLTEMIKELRSSTNSLASLSAQMDRNMKNGEYNVREILTPTLLQLQGSLQDMSRFFNTATRFVDKVDKNPYDSLFGKQNDKSK